MSFTLKPVSGILALVVLVGVVGVGVLGVVVVVTVVEAGVATLIKALALLLFPLKSL